MTRIKLIDPKRPYLKILTLDKYFKQSKRIWKQSSKIELSEKELCKNSYNRFKTKQTNMAAHIYNPSTWEMRYQDQRLRLSWLHSEFKTSLGYETLSFKNRRWKLTNEMKDLYNKNFKTLTKETEELSRWKFLCSWANSILGYQKWFTDSPSTSKLQWFSTQ